MAASSIKPCCIDCGMSLRGRDRDRSVCSACRSPRGKLADLQIAIEAPGDDPSRVSEWSEIRHFLRKRFGDDRTEGELWERFCDWLGAECGLDPEEYLRIPLRDVRDLLADDRNPGGAVALQIVYERLRCFAEVMLELTRFPEYREAAPEDRQRWDDLSAAVQGAIGCKADAPGDPDPAQAGMTGEWSRLARVIRVPAVSIRAGQLSAAAVMEIASAWANQRVSRSVGVSGSEPSAAGTEDRNSTQVPQKKAKRNERTLRGGAKPKLIAALTKHHQYADGGVLNSEPIVAKDLARLAKVAPATVSEFFEKQFGSYQGYHTKCGDVPSLVAWLKLLNGEFTPMNLFGARPPGEDSSNDDE